MRLTYAFLATAAEISPDGKFYVLGGDFDTLQAARLPLVQPVIAVVLRFAVAPEESRVERQMHLSLHRPDGELIGEATEFPIIPTPISTQPTREAGLCVVVNLLTTTFSDLGTYSVRISVDGQEVGNLPLHIEASAT